MSDQVKAGQDYASAYEAHYTSKNLRDAIGRYRGIMEAHAASPEAGYARAQILNIANSVVSKDALFESHLSLALAVLGDGEKAPPVAEESR